MGRDVCLCAARMDGEFTIFMGGSFRVRADVLSKLQRRRGGVETDISHEEAYFLGPFPVFDWQITC